MKKLSFLIYGLLWVTVITSCMNRNDGNTQITLKESDHSYSMKAHFSKYRMMDVEKYLNDQIGKDNDMLFANTEIDARLTLNDKTEFYMEKSPGNLEIKLDKDENSYESYKKIKAICERLKKIIVKQ